MPHEDSIKRYALTLALLMAVVTVVLPCVLASTHAGAMSMTGVPCIEAAASQSCARQALIQNSAAPSDWPAGSSIVGGNTRSIVMDEPRDWASTRIAMLATDDSYQARFTRLLL